MPGELAKPVGTGKNRRPTARHGPATDVVTEHDTPPTAHPAPVRRGLEPSPEPLADAPIREIYDGIDD